MLPVDSINWFLSLGTIAMQVVAIALLVAYLFRDKHAVLASVTNQVGEWGMWATFILAIAGTALTLFYSEIVGYVPCGLCWLVRVFLYPQVILLGMALWKKDRTMADYSLGLSIPGALVALYTHYIQMGGAKVLPCPASGVSDCAKRLVFEFGYITMPMMGLTLLGLMVVIMLIVRSQRSVIQLPADH
jgi:disulfide bond formation protein DsbB